MNPLIEFSKNDLSVALFLVIILITGFILICSSFDKYSNMGCNNREEDGTIIV